MKYDAPCIDGWMSSDELQWLFEEAGKYKQIAEVGSWAGRSTHALLSGCPGTVYAVDHWKGSPSELDSSHKRIRTDDIYAEFQRNVGHFPNLRILRCDSAEAAARFPDEFLDMVFIDGEHAYEAVRRDLLAWRPKVRTLLCGHDVGQDGVGPALADSGVKIRNGPGSIWIADALGNVAVRGKDVEVWLQPLSTEARGGL